MSPQGVSFLAPMDRTFPAINVKDHLQHGHQQLLEGRWPRWPMAPGTARLAESLGGQGSPEKWDV